MDAVDATERLDGLHVLELLVHHQCVQQGLVEARLVLLGDDEHVAVVVELGLRLAFGDALAVVADVEGRFGVLGAVGAIRGIADAPENATSTSMSSYPFFLHIALDLVVVANRREA